MFFRNLSGKMTLQKLEHVKIYKLKITEFA